MATPEQVLAFATQEAERLGVPADLVRNTVMAESGGNISARSTKGAIGPMQLMPETAKDLGVDPRNWQQNVSGGIQYLGKMLNRFGSPELAAAAYNAGPGNVDKYGGIPPFKETQDYVKKVVKMEQSKDEDFIPFGSSKSQLAAAPSNEDFIPFKGNVTSQQQPQSFAGDVKAGVVQAVKGGTPTAQAITSALDIISNLAYKGATALGVPKSVLGPNSAQAELERRAQEASAQPTRTIGQTFSDLGTLATNRPGLLLGSLAVPDPTSLFLPAKIAGATEKALTTAGTAARTAERSGQVAGAAGTGVAQAALSQVGAPNADQFGTDFGMSLITAPLAAIGGARTPKPAAQLTPEQQALAEAAGQGLKVPLGQMTDSKIIKGIEAFAGRKALGDKASEVNRDVVSNQAKQVLGLKPTDEITIGSFDKYRDQQGKAYDVLRSTNYGRDTSFTDNLKTKADELRLLDDPASDSAANLIDRYSNKLYFGGNELVEKIKSLRAKGRKDMSSQDTDKIEMGKTRLFLAEQLEDLADRTLVDSKNANAVRNFREARQNIARSYTLEDTFNAVTGEVNARAIGKKMADGGLVPKELRTIGAASQFMPSDYLKRVSQSSDGGMTGTEAAGAAASVVSGRPDLAALLTGRAALRAGLMSSPVQRMMTPNAPVVGPVKPSARPVVMPYLATTPFQPVTRGLLDYMNQ